MRGGRLALGVLALAGTLSVVSAAPAQPDAGKKEKDHAAQGGPHNIQTSLSKKQFGLKQQALKDKLAGKAVGKVHEVAKGQFVEMALEKTDRIFVVIAEFGNARHIQFPSPGDPCTVPPPFVCFNPDGTAATYVGPLHNSIPEPDRAVDNSTLWQADYNQAHYDNMYFNRMNSFFKDQSSGRYAIEGAVTDWVRVPFNEARYGRDFCGGIVCNNTWQLIRHAINIWVADQLAAGRFPNVAAATEYLKTFDRWDRYDFDGDGNFDERDGYIDHFQIVHAGGDQAAGDPQQGTDAIWSHRWYVNTGQIGVVGPNVDGTPNRLGGWEIGGPIPASSQIGGAPITFPTNQTGIWVGDYTIQPENGGLGVFAHEYAHDLGLPDLYDTSGNVGGAENSTGFWTLMSSGANIGDGGPNGIQDAPTNLGAWEKLQLGWLTYDLTSAGAKKSEHRINALGVTTKQVQAVIVNLPKELNPNVLELGGTQAFWSGRGDNLDNTMTRDVTLPAAPVTLSFKAWYEIETCWDYAYLRVSTNGGTSYTNVQTSISDAGNENGQNFGHGITGISGQPKHCDEASGSPAWVNATADLSAFAGQTVKLQFRYWTDGFVIGRGFVVDDIAVNGTSIGTGAADEGWTFSGFSTTTGGQTTLHDHYYIAEYRPYHDHDTSLRTAYNFGFAGTRPDWVEHYPYQDGLLVNYWDTGESNNNVGDHPGAGLILPVDAHPTLIHQPNGQLWRGRVQTYDSTFGLEPTDAITLHLAGVPTAIGSLPAVQVFDDRLSYWSNSDAHGATGSHPGHYQPGWFGVKTPNTGTAIRVKNLQAQGLFAHVEVGPAG
jgi:immune inhibitor A